MLCPVEWSKDAILGELEGKILNPDRPFYVAVVPQVKNYSMFSSESISTQSISEMPI